MRDSAPFQRDDLRELDERLLCRALAVIPMFQVAAGDTKTTSIGLRHDVDDNPGSLHTALELALWEYERGWRSTFYMLHTAPYWRSAAFPGIVREIESLGHEIGLHVNALTEAIETGGNPVGILDRALTELRCHATVTGVAAHGDKLCRVHGYVNDEIFEETPRPDMGEPDRVVAGVPLQPVPREWFGLDYDAPWLSRSSYLSDSGGHWSRPFDEVAEEFPYRDGQLHMLVHPDWWGQAFRPVRAAA